MKLRITDNALKTLKAIARGERIDTPTVALLQQLRLIKNGKLTAAGVEALGLAKNGKSPSKAVRLQA
jgi:hypothetical protein